MTAGKQVQMSDDTAAGQLELHHRRLPWLLLTIAVLCLFTGNPLADRLLFAAGQQPTAARPNVVLIVADDMGWGDLGVQGAAGFSTPQLDRLAAAEWLLSEMFRDCGYAVGGFGKWHLGTRAAFHPQRHGSNELLGIPYSSDNSKYHPVLAAEMPPLPLYDGERVLELDPDQSCFTSHFTRRAIEFMERNVDRPFFVYLPHVMPHVPIFASREFVGRSKQGGVRVPCLVGWPGKVPAGRVCDVPFMGIDWLPTLTELAGGKQPELLIDGRSVAALLLDRANAVAPHEILYFYSGTSIGSRCWKSPCFSWKRIQATCESGATASGNRAAAARCSRRHAAGVELGDSLRGIAGRGLRAPGLDSE